MSEKEPLDVLTYDATLKLPYPDWIESTIKWHMGSQRIKRLRGTYLELFGIQF